MGANRPNILWLMTDEQRCDSMGCYGSAWAQTPNLDRLASRGVRFNAAYTPSPVCLPARTAILAGQYPAQTGVWSNVDGAFWHNPHLTHTFASAGYRTATFGKQHYGGETTAFGLERHLTYSRHLHAFYYAEPYDESQYNVVHYPTDENPWVFAGRFPADASQAAEAESVQAALRWLDQNASAQPFLLRVSFNAPHTPVAPPAPFDTLIDEDAVQFPAEAEAAPPDGPAWAHRDLASKSRGDRLTREQIRRMRACYYGQVAFADQQFGIVLDALEARGLLENTIVIMVSDHGTHLGDYNLVQKQSFYEVCARVPMLIAWPGQLVGGRTIDAPVSASALLPTCLELAGIDVPQTVTVPSLAPLLRGEAGDAGPVFSGLTLASFGLRPDDRLVMVRQGPWKLSLCLDPQRHDHYLVNLDDDPLELKNRYGDADCRDVQKQLERLIEAHVAEAIPIRKPPVRRRPRVG